MASSTLMLAIFEQVDGQRVLIQHHENHAVHAVRVSRATARDRSDSRGPQLPRGAIPPAWGGSNGAWRVR